MHKALETIQSKVWTKLSVSSSKFKDVNGDLFPNDWIDKETHIHN